MPITTDGDGALHVAFGVGDVGFGRIGKAGEGGPKGLYFGQLPSPGPVGKRYDVDVTTALRVTFKDVAAVSLLIGYLRGMEKEFHEGLIGEGGGRDEN